MNRNYALLCLFGILTRFIVVIVARKAILNGKLAELEDAPYQAALQIEGKSSFCGGGIIGVRWIITAASCVTNSNGRILNKNMSVLIEVTNLHQVHPDNRKVEKVYVPDNYNSRPITDDIAVLRLYLPLWLTPGNEHDRPYLRVLRLPPPDGHKLYARKTVKINGFGVHNVVEINGQPKKESDARLRFLTARVLQNSICEEHFTFSSRVKITNKMLCAKSINYQTGVCDYDIGSPLVDNGTTVIGVLNHHTPTCYEDDESAVYTRVSYYLDFIHNAQGDVNLTDIHHKTLMSKGPY